MSLEVSGDLINEGQLFLDLSKQIVSFMSKSRPQAGVADRAFSSHTLVLSKVATCASYTEPHSKKACKMRVWSNRSTPLALVAVLFYVAGPLSLYTFSSLPQVIS